MTDTTTAGATVQSANGSKSEEGGRDVPARSETPASEAAFDYGRSAELFPTRSRKPRRNATTYKRFDTAAAAVRFAIEELPSDLLLGAYLQVEEDRFGSEGIRRLYDSPRYPLKRRPASQR